MARSAIDEPDMPPCDALYLVEHLFEAGPIIPTGTGSAPLSFSEIRAWQECTGIRLDAFESRALRYMSIAYVNESYAAQKRDCQAPWSRDGERSEVSDTQQALRNLSKL